MTVRAVQSQSMIFSVLRLVNQVAKYQFLMMPACAYSQTNSEIPSAHQNFWNSMSICELYSLYKASPSKILELTEEPTFDNPAQQRVFHFLCDFVGNMRMDESRTLRFVTGSSVCLAKK